MSGKFCTYCGQPVTPGARFCTSCGSPLQQAPPASAPTDCWPMPAGQAAAASGTSAASVSDTSGAIIDTARFGLAVALILGALATSWSLEASTTDKPLVLAFLVLALFALVSDFVLQPAIVGRPVAPLHRLMIRVGLALPLVLISIVAVLQGDFGDTMKEYGEVAYLYPAVGFGPAMTLTGALLVVGGRWRDRSSTPSQWWQWTTGAFAVLAVLLCAIEVIRGIQGVGAWGDRGISSSSGSLWALGLAPWLVILLVALTLVALVFARPRWVWPVTSVVGAAWGLTVLITAIIGGDATLDAMEGEGGAAFAVGGPVLLLAAVALASAPALAPFTLPDPAERWLLAARGGTVVTVAGLLALTAQVLGILPSAEDMEGVDGVGVSKGALIWMLIACVFGAAGAVVSLLALRNPGQGRLIGGLWAVAVGLLLGFTWLLSDTARDVLGQSFGLGLSTSFVPAAIVAIPFAVAGCLFGPASLRARFGAVLPVSGGQPGAAQWSASGSQAQAPTPAQSNPTYDQTQTVEFGEAPTQSVGVDPPKDANKKE